MMIFELFVHQLFVLQDIVTFFNNLMCFILHLFFTFI